MKRSDITPLTEAAVHGLTIRGWLPVRINTLLGMHWSARSRVKEADYAVVAASCNYQDIPKATGKRRVSATFYQPLGPLADPDARLKVLLDALVACNRLIDDSPKWCELGRVTCERGKRVTEIELEDMT